MDTISRIVELEDQLQKARKEIEKQKIERTLDKEHLEVLAKQQLARSINKMVDRLSHEIAEARVCLDDPPNIRMTLDRLQNMERFLNKMRKVD
jgi:hypothetical protein